MNETKGIIFDFNGTLFFDTPFHEQAWRIYVRRLCGRDVTDGEFRDSVHGRTNAEILAHFVGDGLSETEVDRHAETKEDIYRRLCLQDPDKFCLAPGAEAYLNKCKRQGIPMAIATSSGRSNAEFYRERFGMGRWFDDTTFVYNDGTIRSKPHPDIYLKAAAALGLPPQDCTVFEDMPSGIAAARAAGAGQIVAVASALTKEYLAAFEGVTCVIGDYREMLSR